MAQQVTNLLNGVTQNKQEPQKEATNKPEQQATKKSPEINEKEMEALRAQVVKKKTLENVPKDKLEPFIQYLGIYKQKMLDEERYLDARDTANLIEACKNVQENYPPVPPIQAIQTNSNPRNNSRVQKYISLILSILSLSSR